MKPFQILFMFLPQLCLFYLYSPKNIKKWENGEHNIITC